MWQSSQGDFNVGDAAEFLPSRSVGLPDVCSIDHLVDNKLIPGAPGVILANKSVPFLDFGR